MNVLKLVNLVANLQGPGYTAQKRACLKILEYVATFTDAETSFTLEESQERVDKIGEIEDAADGQQRMETIGGTTMVMKMIMAEPKATAPGKLVRSLALDYGFGVRRALQRSCVL